MPQPAVQGALIAANRIAIERRKKIDSFRSPFNKAVQDLITKFKNNLSENLNYHRNGERDNIQGIGPADLNYILVDRSGQRLRRIINRCISNKYGLESALLHANEEFYVNKLTTVLELPDSDEDIMKEAYSEQFVSDLYRSIQKINSTTDFES